MKTILDEAKKIVEGDRLNEYGNASKCFETIAGMWSAYLGINLTPYDVANMMIQLKIVRTKGKGFQRDSFVDIAGYAYCAEIITNEALERQNELCIDDVKRAYISD